MELAFRRCRTGACSIISLAVNVAVDRRAVGVYGWIVNQKGKFGKRRMSEA